MFTVWIIWEEKESELAAWRYVGGGVTEPVMREKTVTRRARWETVPAERVSQSVAAATEYIRHDHPDATVVVIKEDSDVQA